MKVAIIGAGKMGRWFASFFLKQGFSVVVSDKDKDKLRKISEELNVETASNIEAVKKAHRIFVCVPIERFEEVIAEIHAHFRPGQEVLDICSIKERPIEIMHKYIKKGVVLGTHPMFGPGAKSIEKQNFVLTPTNAEEEKLAEDFGRWLESKGAKVFKMSPKEHDKLMSMVIGLPYFLSLVTCDTIISHSSFTDAKKVSGASYKVLLTLAEAIASEETDFSTSLQMNLPEVDKIEELFLKKAAEWLDLVKRRDRVTFAYKVEQIKNALGKASPNYLKSYEALYKMLEALKNGN
ncbi:MAG: prephenate dehydrogenase/arogenate dehydrogenase family protein [Nitrososphaerota archaeon]|nr:prephenate dehydrogenase/arogenate dehydrogenase family protein [Candidatus Bathyarchaeota archaeon]MDW8022297.1 prephenate dehydrogenase/arogenate dehydrogenase family protein [Nitrososphaerota archaeon]